MTSKPLLAAINPRYYPAFLQWHGVAYEQFHRIFKIPGFADYNHLVDINRVFSSAPHGDLVDRTQTVQAPAKFGVFRPWRIPQSTGSLEQVMQVRVEYFTAQDKMLNLCWSGGIDSSAMLTAFLKHAKNLDQLQIIHSPFSVYENPDYYEFIRQNFPQVKWLDISGDVYTTVNIDGLMINGHGSDEFNASLDESFIEKFGGQALHAPWKDLFRQTNSSDEFIDFCEQYFALSGREICSVLEARWWFYASNKTQYFAVQDNTFLQTPDQADLSQTRAFYDFAEFESFVYFDINRVIADCNDYRTHKQYLKDYTFGFNGDKNYNQHKQKGNSFQFLAYWNKKMYLNDLRYVFKLTDGTIVRTKNLPFFSQVEFDEKYGRSLDYLFNFC